MTCQNAREFLGLAEVEVAETMDAAKVRYGPDEVIPLLDGVVTLIAAKGKKVEVFDLVDDRPADADLLARLLGPTGNLRAPTARVGPTLVVGFHADAYRRLFAD